jgi:hypothetical protein
VDSGTFKVAVGGDRLKHFDIDAPSAAAELMDKSWGIAPSSKLVA